MSDTDQGLQAQVKELDALLSSHNCYVDGYIVTSLDGKNESQVGIVPFRQAGESSEDQSSRVEACKSEVDKYLSDQELDWDVKAIIARQGNQMVFSLRKIEAQA